MNPNWKNISSDFTPELQKEWEESGFSYEQCQEWVNIGIKPNEAKFAAWLRDEIKKTPEEILNSGDWEDLEKQFREYRKKETEEEEIITNILEKVLDGWKAEVSGLEKEDIRYVINKLAKNQGTKREQYEAVQTLLVDYPSFKTKNNKSFNLLNSFLKQWEKLLPEEPEQKPDEEIPPLWEEEKPETEDPFIPDWLFETPEEPKKPTKSPKPKKTPKPPPPKEKPHECRICDKNIFYSRKEFAEAHRGSKPKNEPYWVYKNIIICKNPIITKQMWVCKVCKQENHTDKCKYYLPPQPIVSPPEIFDWENYWKWWFGVLNLDWDSSRFFENK